MSRNAVVAGLAFLAACEGAGEAEWDPGRPAEKIWVIRPESAPVTFRLFQSPDNHELQFSTYAPAEWTIDVGSENGASHVTFSMPGDSGESPGALHFYVYPRGTPIGRAQIQLEAFVASRGVPVSEQERIRAPFSEEGIPPESGTSVARQFAWAKWESAYAHACAFSSSTCITGRVGLGLHDERVFHINMRHAAAQVARVYPRIQIILDEWRWQNGLPLNSDSVTPSRR